MWQVSCVMVLLVSCTGLAPPEKIGIDGLGGPSGDPDDTSMDGVPPAHLVVSAATLSFGPVGITDSATLAVTLSNDGGAPTGAIAATLSGANAADFSAVTAACDPGVAPGASCQVSATFTPSSGGNRVATLVLAAPGIDGVEVALSGAGHYRLTIYRTGAAAGTVVASAASASNLVCGTGCGQTSLIYAPSTLITLVARGPNGSNVVFDGWTGDCALRGRQQTCTLTMLGARNVEARFRVSQHNLVFVSSASYPATLGSAEAYDTACNALASAAGINDADAPAGAAYIAWLASSTSLPQSAGRLGTSARGFVRIDGLPFADLTTDLVPDNRILNTVAFDETGNQQAIPFGIATSVTATGTVSPYGTCADWTSQSGNYGIGYLSGGPIKWTETFGFYSCLEPMRLICLQRTRSNPVSTLAIPSGGKRIFVTKGSFTPGAGIAAAQALCDDVAEQPGGSGSWTALLETSSKTFYQHLVGTVAYYNVAGQFLGTGLMMVDASGQLFGTAGAWVHGDGTYFTTGTERTVWSYGPCGDWMSTGGWGSGGYNGLSGREHWGGAAIECIESRPVYCVEQ